jgi:hypothetical protein
VQHSQPLALETTEPDALARDSELLSTVLHEVLVEQAGESTVQ